MTLAEALCRDAADLSRPCPFAGTCHLERRRLQSGLELRGTGCWAYQQLSHKIAGLAHSEAALERHAIPAVDAGDGPAAP